MMTLTAALKTPKVVRFAEPVTDGEHGFISDFDKTLPDIFAREENTAHDALNKDTFDPDNDLWMCFGNFDFNQRTHVKIPERHNRSEYYFTTPHDNVCSCEFYVASQLSTEEKDKAGCRLYIPRLRVADPTYDSSTHIYQQVTKHIGSFCNIVNIDFKWLWDAGDFSAFIYLHPQQPFKTNKLGQTAMCNLSCPKCKSLNVHINQHIFWKVLPQV